MSDIVNIIRHSADLLKPLEKTDLHTLFVMGDNQAHRFELEILSGSAAADLEGATVTGYFTNFKEDTTVTVPGKVEGGKAVVTLSKPCYTLHGQFVLTIQVKSGEVEDTVFLGEGFMRRTKGETIIYDDYIVYDVNTLMAHISAMRTATDNANAATTKATNAASAANTAAGNANTKAQAAQTAAEAANAAAQNWSNGTAANAIQLNGKDSAYYLQPIEMLDNVDFAIAQAGYGGMHGAFAYASDRWHLQDGTFARNGEVNTLTCSEYGFVQQKVNEEKGKLNGKAVTVAIVLEDGTVKVANATIPSEDVTGSTAYIAQLRLATNAVLILLKTTSQETIVRLAVDSGYSFSFKRIHLLVGSYTADTLPPYVPKGYSAELAECQRYFYIPTKTGGVPFAGYAAGSSHARFLFILPAPMIRQPTISITDMSAAIIKSNAGQHTVTEVNGTSYSGQTIVAYVATSGLTDGNTCVLNPGEIIFSADI